MQSLQMDKPRIAAYCRVSTDKNDQMMSLHAQQEFFKDYAEKNNFNLVELYTDEGISGTQLKKRRGFNQMMKDAKGGAFEAVYVKDISRFARNAVDFLNSIRTLKAMGISCRFITANLGTEDGELTLGILALVAQEESANLSKRVRFGKEKNAKAGKVPNFVYGYDKQSNELFSLSVNGFEADIVRRIFELYVHRGLGAGKIASILNEEGIKTKRNCKWTQTAICRLLANPIYIGTVINGKEHVDDYLTGRRKKALPEEWHVAQDKVPALIEAQTFQRAQQLLSQNSFQKNQGRGQHRSNKHLFSTLIKCECCGYSFRRIHRRRQNGRDYIKWVCSGHNINGASFCPNQTVIDEKQLFETIVTYLNTVIKDKPQFLKKVAESIQKKDQSMEETEQKKVLQREFLRLKKVKSKQIQMYENDAITLEELKERVGELNRTIVVCQNKLARWEDEGAAGQETTLMKELCGDLNSILCETILDNVTLKNMMKEITVSEHGEIKVFMKKFREL